MLVSGTGTNLQALLDACADPAYGATVVAVGADRDDIEGLERADHARARGAKIYGRLAGIGMSNDAFHITAPEPEGEGSGRAILKALKSADLSPADIGHVNAHATSTPVGDLAESKTILKYLGDHPVVTATKSMTGHLFGAAGALETAVCALAVRDGIVPPTINLQQRDAECDLDYVDEGARRVPDLRYAISNSMGLGGHNGCTLLARV